MVQLNFNDFRSDLDEIRSVSHDFRFTFFTFQISVTSLYLILEL